MADETINLEQDSREPETDLGRGLAALMAKQDPMTKFWQYYDGEQPLKYVSARLKEVFPKIDAEFRENWCGMIVDTVIDRLTLSGLSVRDNDELSEKLQELWDDHELDLLQREIHRGCEVCGEAYIVVEDAQDDEERSGEPRGPESLGDVHLFYNDPRLCHVFYSTENPRQKTFAVKWWIDEEKHRRLTLYYADHFEYYRSTCKASNVISEKNFEPIEDEVENPWGEIPVFRFIRQLRGSVSALKSITTIQDAVNKLFNDMMIAAEFGAFRQRWIISNADDLDLRNAPNEIWPIPAGDGEGEGTSVGEFDITPLDNFTSAMDRLAATIAIISRTPKHYFALTASDVSGDALIAMEGPLIAKVKGIRPVLASTWRELAVFLASRVGADVQRSQIDLGWTDLETVLPSQQANLRESNRRAGLPLATILRDEGKSPADLEQVKKDLLEEKKAEKGDLMDGLLDEQMKNFDQE